MSTYIPKYLLNSIKVIDEWLKYQRIFKRIAGLTVGIVYKDEIVFTGSYGYKNIKNKEKMSDNTLFRIASISKVFTAVSILQLVEQGKLKLDDKVLTYLPWLGTSDKNSSHITIRQLLSHSSGVNRDGDRYQWFDDNFPDLEDIKRQAKDGFSVYEPLEKFKYSNIGYTLLGAVIANVSGETYEEYVTKNIVKKLKLKNTYPEFNKEIEGKLATGYGRDIPGQDREGFPNPRTNAMVSATGFVSNASDLCTFLSSQFLGNESLLSDLSKRDMQRTNWVRKTGDKNYGLGLTIWENDKRQLIGHGGGFQGFATQIAFDQNEKIGVAVLTNIIDGQALSLANGIFHTINYFKDHQEDFGGSRSNEFNKYEGTFTGRWGDVEIVNINDHLLSFELNRDKPLEEPYRLEHVTKDTFKIMDCSDFDYLGEKVHFELNSHGKVTGVLLGPAPLIKSEEFK